MTTPVVVDPILRHPWAAIKPKDEQDFKGKSGELVRAGIVGGVLGLGAGVAAVKLLHQRAVDKVLRRDIHSLFDHTVTLPFAADPLGFVNSSVGVGGGLGIGAVAARQAYDHISRHAEAAQQYEAQTGRKIPFMARHPYLLSAAPALGGAALGAAVAGKGLGMRTLGASGGLLVGGLAGSPLLANAGADARAAFFDVHKQANTINPILLHPTLVKRPATPEEAEARGKDYAGFMGTGAALGTLAGAGLGLYLAKRYGDGDMPAHMAGFGGAVGGALAGTVAGGAGAYFKRYAQAIQEHDAAARQYEAQSGTKLPFSVRHPHAMLWGPMALGTAAGAALGSHARLGLSRASRPVGAAMGLMGAAMTAAPLSAAHAYAQRRDMFKDKVGPLSTEMYGGDFGSDIQTLEDRQKQRDEVAELGIS
jgi:hypothetical protein